MGAAAATGPLHATHIQRPGDLAPSEAQPKGSKADLHGVTYTARARKELEEQLCHSSACACLLLHGLCAARHRVVSAYNRWQRSKRHSRIEVIDVEQCCGVSNSFCTHAKNVTRLCDKQDDQS